MGDGFIEIRFDVVVVEDVEECDEDGFVYFLCFVVDLVFKLDEDSDMI